MVVGVLTLPVWHFLPLANPSGQLMVGGILWVAEGDSIVVGRSGT